MNYTALSKEAAILKDHSKKAWKCWMWIMIGLVMVIFICMYYGDVLSEEHMCFYINIFFLSTCFSYGPVYESHEKESFVEKLPKTDTTKCADPSIRLAVSKKNALQL